MIIQDEAVLLGVRKALCLKEDAEITEEMLASVTQLYIYHAVSLEELRLFPNLCRLHLERSSGEACKLPCQLPALELLDFHHCTDLPWPSLLAQTQLSRLSASFCQIGHVPALAEMEQLAELSLEFNQISDISFLAGMKRLRKLNLIYNQITDISILAELGQLTHVQLSGNPVASVAPLLAQNRLRLLEIDIPPLKDRHLLSQGALAKAIPHPMDIPEAFPDQWKAQQEKKLRKPRVKILADIHSRAYFCKSAVLVSLTNGMNRIVSRKDISKTARKNKYAMFCDEELLVRTEISGCCTCASYLYRGYGDGIMNLEECLAVRDQINAGFTDLHEAVQKAAPLLGLFASGTYMVADYELVPRFRKDFFWKESVFTEEPVRRWYSYGEAESSDAPIYILPTQRAALMNPERVDYYVSRMQEGKHFPRAVAFYMSADIALLLDGHHKAAAAALQGEPVRCLVFFKVDHQKELMEAVENGQRLYLRNGKKPGLSDPLHLILHDNTVVGKCRGLMYGKQERVFTHEKKKEELLPWGEIPPEYLPDPSRYPSDALLYMGTHVPRDEIQKTIQRLMDTLWFIPESRRYIDRDKIPREDARTMDYLLAYAQLFPESKFLTEKQRKWLIDYDLRPFGYY